MLGGAFLCYEGFEKLAHRFLHKDRGEHVETVRALADPSVDMVAFEKKKISGAVRTDFILSAEIIAITLGTIAAASFSQQVLVLVGIAILMTVGVYGLVAAIVKLDDLGLALSKRASGVVSAIGRGILSVAPWLMKSLSVIGTAAMFMVGGGILTHGIRAVHHFIESSAHDALGLPYVGAVLGGLLPTLLDAAFGIVAGALVLALVTLGGRLFKRGSGAAA
jgi:hypothetical protein